MAHDRSFHIEPFSPAIPRASFHSGEDALDSWLHHYAGQSERKHSSRTRWALEEHSNTIAGYYSLVVAVVGPEEAGTVSLERRHYSIPGILLARLAVGREHQGRGIGSALLADALTTCCAVSRLVGVRVILVDALHREAASFYSYHGFSALGGNPLRLFLPITTALAAQAR